MLISIIVLGVMVIIAAILILPSIRAIGPTEVGLVTKRFSMQKLTEDNPVAFRGEAGYQGELLMPGWRFKLWLIYAVEKFPWVQVPAGEIGVVIAQVGKPLPIGAKSAVYKSEFSNFTDLKTFIEKHGQKGVQRPVLPPGSLLPIHPIAFLVVTKRKVFGVPIDPKLKLKYGGAGLSSSDPFLKAAGVKEISAPVVETGMLSSYSFGLRPDQLDLTMISPQKTADNKMQDVIGIVTTLEGQPLPANDIAGRLGGYSDVGEMEKNQAGDSEIIEVLLGNKNQLHNNYQDFQAFLDSGGRIGLQHDPLLCGAYTINPFLVRVEIAPMLVVEQGEVVVIKAYVGLPTKDTSGTEFKFGSLVRPGHRGIWQEPLRTGKYPINPHCYQWEKVPTCILTLNWAEAFSQAHNLDKQLQQIVAKSCEGFIFKIDLQVQIHVPDTNAPRVISMVGTMYNLVNEVLQAAVGNHFRDKLQSMPAIKFIATRQDVQMEAFEHIKNKLDEYRVETKGVYIQDVVLPEHLVAVLTEREIANQQIETYKKQQSSQQQRIETEKARGTADMQAELAKSKVGVDIKANNAGARKAEADGEAYYIRETGTAKGAEVRAVGTAKAEAYKMQVDALGKSATTFVNAIEALGKGNTKFVPDVLVMGGEGSGSLNGLAGVLTQLFNTRIQQESEKEKG